MDFLLDYLLSYSSLSEPNMLAGSGFSGITDFGVRNLGFASGVWTFFRFIQITRPNIQTMQKYHQYLPEEVIHERKVVHLWKEAVSLNCGETNAEALGRRV